MKRNVVVISELIPKPDVDEIAKIRRGNYRDVFQLVKGLELNINFTENPIVSEFLINSFEDTVYGEADRLGTGANINKILNKAVYLLCFINRYRRSFLRISTMTTYRVLFIWVAAMMKMKLCLCIFLQGHRLMCLFYVQTGQRDADLRIIFCMI